MSPVSATCAGCGAAVEFRLDASLVTICAHCHAVVARSDRGVETLGKLADLVETRSPLRVGLEGAVALQGASGPSPGGAGRASPGRFELVGRAQIRHARGGLWDEWYAAFANGRWGWIAEAQGRLYLTFRFEGLPSVPPYDALRAGEPLEAIPGSRFVVGERAEAEYVAAEGEIPFRLEPGSRFRYADLAGPGGAFATIDYGGDYSEAAPIVFVGREVTLADLGLAGAVRPEADYAAPKLETARLACPECDGNLELRAPESERVACPYCGALSDVNQGQLVFLKALAKAPQPLLPLGAEAEIGGEKRQVVGMLRRYVIAYGVRYDWEEYLLYERRGFAWLVCSDGHWSLVEPVKEVVDERGNHAVLDGRSYKFFQAGSATVAHVLGEMPWKVEAGEEVNTTDYVSPPYMLSKEVGPGEVNWSLGRYLPVAEVERAFGVTLPAPEGVGATQPFRHTTVYALWGAFAVVALLLFLISGSGSQVVFRETIPIEGASEAQPAIWFAPQSIALRGDKNLRIEVEAPVDNDWVFVQGDLFREETGLVQEFGVAVERYSGVEDGEAWSEGSGSADAWLSALPAGDYQLRLEISRGSRADRVNVTIEQGVVRLSRFLLLLGLLSLVPIATVWHQVSFEKQRWARSDVE